MKNIKIIDNETKENSIDLRNLNKIIQLFGYYFENKQLINKYSLEKYGRFSNDRFFYEKEYSKHNKIYTPKEGSYYLINKEIKFSQMH